MNVEVFSYSIMASILGIAIVFTSLVLLSLLMVALKAVFGERVKPSQTEVEVKSSAAPAPAAATAVKREDNGWVMAAVAAFLAGEDEKSPKAGGWVPSPREATDPWMNRVVFEKEIR